MATSTPVKKRAIPEFTAVTKGKLDDVIPELPVDVAELRENLDNSSPHLGK